MFLHYLFGINRTQTALQPLGGTVGALFEPEGMELATRAEA